MLALKTQLGIFRLLVYRRIRDQYVGSGAGLLWALFVPMAQLAIYAFVFVEVFRIRFPGMDSGGYVAFVAVAMWPWNAFAESLTRATSSVNDHRELIGRISVPFELLPLTSVTASFLVHAAGFAAILLVLALFGQPIAAAGLPGAALLLVVLYLLTLALAYLGAATNVYVRDLAHALPPLLMLWYFATPILYPAQFVPDRYQAWLALNPMTAYASRFREYLLGGALVPGLADLRMLLLAGVLLIIALAYFRRLSRHFEDYL